MGREAVAEAVAAVLAAFPEVHTGRHNGAVNFLVGDKVLAFVKGESLAIKLPRPRIDTLAGEPTIAPLVMGKRTMKEWVVITHDDPADFARDRLLFAEAIAFVGGTGTTAKDRGSRRSGAGGGQRR